MIKNILIIFALASVPLHSFALTQKDCSLRCKGRFFSQKGIKSIESFIQSHPEINNKIIDATMEKSDQDLTLALGCLAKCKVKDIRDSICLLMRENDSKFIEGLAKIFSYNKNAGDFSKEHESSCKKLFPKDADSISKNYAYIQRLLLAKSN